MPHIKRNIHRGKSLAVFTSGGDSSGMNGAIRACVRMAIFLGCQPYMIYEGYQGLVEGGNYFVKANWTSVSGIIHRGGTIIGTARCSEFRERKGRLKAALNLVKNEINRLVVIGGDGSLTGANIFRKEWPGLMDELLKTGEINAAQREKFTDLHIVGLVGSIDNDFCGTDMTIGVDTALQRITAAIDAITSTAFSHQRTFVMEVMGRHCGYLSLIAGFIAEADYVFCPEMPPPRNWQDVLCEKLSKERNAGARVNIIIVAEGATDMDGEAISAEMIKNVIVDKLKHDTRVTVLGHVQRGGQPSAYDRVLSCRQGAEATIAVLDSTSKTVPVVIGVAGVRITRVPLMEAVERTQAVAKAMADKQWEVAVKLRGYWFCNTLKTIRKMSSVMPEATVKKCTDPTFRLAVMHIGSAACGMNAAVRSFVRHVIANGNIPYGISNGFDGLISGKFKKLSWTEVSGWVAQGGAFLGITRTPADGKYPEIARNLRQFQIDGLLIIGGFEAYRSMLLLIKQRPNYPEFCIPMAVIPSTPSNNMPGTDYTLGSDTTLNEIVEITDRIRSSARGSGKRVYIIETMGAYCGYLATLAALAGGADTAYIFEEKFTVSDLKTDVVNMIAKMNDGVDRGLVLRAEFASVNYSTDFIWRLFQEEGKDTFTCDMNILGQLQQGGTPTPFDRGLGTRLGATMSDWFQEQLYKGLQPDRRVRTTTKESACMLGIVDAELQFTPLVELIQSSDFTYNLSKSNWYLQLRPLLKVLSVHSTAYDGVEAQLKPADVNCAIN